MNKTAAILILVGIAILIVWYSQSETGQQISTGNFSIDKISQKLVKSLKSIPIGGES